MPFKPKNLRKFVRAGVAVAGGLGLHYARRALGRRLFGGAKNSTNTTRVPVVRRPYRKARALGRRRNIQNLTSQGSGVASHSKCTAKSYGNSQNRLIKKIGAPNSWVAQATSYISCQDGFQQAGVLGWATNTEINQIAQSSIYTANGGSGTASLGNYPMRYIYESTYGEIMFTNATNHAIDLDIYDIYIKRDIGISETYTQVDTSGNNVAVTWDFPTGAWELGVNNAQNYINPDSTVYPSPPGTTFFGAEYFNFLGSTPFDSQLFKDYYGVQKRTHVQMPLGATHRHHCSFTLNKMVDSRMTNNSTIRAWKGFTRYTMWVVRGYPVNSAIRDSRVDVTTSGALVTAVQSQRTKFTYVLDNRQNVRYFDNLTSLADDSVAVVNTASGVFEHAKNTIINYPT